MIEKKFDSMPLVRLAPLGPENAEEYLQLIRDNIDHFSNFNNMSRARAEIDVQTMQEHLSLGDKKRFGIRTSDGRLVGIISVSPISSIERVGDDWTVTETGDVEIGYLLAQPETGNGYANSAVQNILHQLEQTSRYKQAIAYVNKNNTASQSVLVRCGFTHEKTVTDLGDDMLFTKPLRLADTSTQ